MLMRMVCAVTMAAATGCAPAGVRWEESRSAPADTLGALHLGSDASIGFARPLSAPIPPADSAACDSSVVFARDGDRWYAAWLSRRRDSTVAVVAARSDGGRVWNAAAVVDSLDVGRVGCGRPGPSIAASDGYAHVAYSIEAPEGFGVFFAHTMDQGASFHAPSIVVYGDRLSATAVAADRMLVAVAYEDPSGSRKRIDVALSRTQGHTFEPRERGSPEELPASRPRIAIRDSLLALSFAAADGIGRAVRLGHIR
jgi:hypothetical protein